MLGRYVSCAIERIASRAERTVFFSAPIRTNHPFFQQPNELRHVHAGVEDLIQMLTIDSLTRYLGVRRTTTTVLFMDFSLTTSASEQHSALR